MTDSALAIRASLPTIIATYAQKVEDVRRGFALIRAAETDMDALVSLGEGCNVHVVDRYHRSLDWAEPDEALVGFRRSVWAAIVERLELRRMLSIARARELDHQLRDGELPEITEASVREFADFYREHMPDMLAEAIKEVFDFLRPRRGVYKTNSLLEIGPRVILTSAVELGYGRHWRCRHYEEASLNALESVFLALAGQGAVLKSYHSALVNAINAAPIESGEAGVGETDLFAFRCHRNHTLHLRFKRLDLLAALNRAAGGLHLRPGANEQGAA